MSRLFFLFAIIALVYLLFRGYRRKLSERKKEVVEDMVCCAHCGMHLPRSESVCAAGRDFCSDEHRAIYGSNF